MTKLERDATSSDYEDVKTIIERIAKRYAYKYGGALEDWIEEANWIYVSKVTTKDFDQKQSKYTSFVYYAVHIGLLEVVRSRAMRSNVIRQHSLDAMNSHSKEEYTKYQPSGFRLFEFMEALSPDAREIVKMVFSSPIDLEMAVKQRGRPTPIRIRSAITEVLKDFGWSVPRIVQSFSEIARALK